LFSLKLLVNADTVDDRAGRRLTPSVTLSPLLNAAPAIQIHAFDNAAS
jgi:hypothetical protein